MEVHFGLHNSGSQERFNELNREYYKLEKRYIKKYGYSFSPVAYGDKYGIYRQN